MSREPLSSPKIESISWGRILPASYPAGKDYKLYPGGGRLWDWNETGTRHRPGVSQADVQELLDHGSTTVVLSRGMDLVLQIQPQVVEWLEGLGLNVYQEQTEEAAKLYNQLVDAGVAVGGLFHSTC